MNGETESLCPPLRFRGLRGHRDGRARCALGRPKGGIVATDPNLWLEEVEGDRAIAWARAQNERTLSELQADPRYPRFEAEARRILEARDRIADPVLMAGTVYNFWQDDQHVRGLLRRADWSSYASGSPKWETVLDVDALSAQDGKPWVTGMPDCLAPEYRRCLVALSNGGKDAAILREFDTANRQFVEGGFVLPEAKHSVEWADRDTLLVSTDWGDGSLTESGYPYIVKRWQRGQPLGSATEIFRGTSRDVAVSPARLRDRDGSYVIVIVRSETFFESTFQLLDARTSRGVAFAATLADRRLLERSACRVASGRLERRRDHLPER